MMRDEAEKMIQEKGKIAPRITPQDIENCIVSEYCFTANKAFPTGTPVHSSLELLTIVVLVLTNGFTVTGESACASPENFDAEIGQKIAAKNAREKIWALEGYVLRNRLAGI
jgi:Phage protein (N4 Gp49/phage Sf6 gene 66) family